MSLALLGFAPTLRRQTSSQAPSISCPWGGLYEGYLDDTLGKCFRPLLINRLALGCQHFGSHGLDVGQRPAKSLRSWTPFRLQKIGYTEVLYTRKVLVQCFTLLVPYPVYNHVAAEPQPKLGISPAKTLRPQRSENNNKQFFKIIYLFPPNLACFAPWRESSPLMESFTPCYVEQ